MRIAVGQLWQETNTFNRNPTTLADFENWGVAIGDDVVAQYGETGELGGFLSASRNWSEHVEFVGLARFACWPWGPVSADAWESIVDTFTGQLSRAGKVDAVFLALHGAMSADGEPDITGALLSQVRAVVGPNVPIVGSLDLHANITTAMLEHADVLAGYHTCPHLDAFETGARAAKALRRILAYGVSPVTRWRKLPLITAAENHNTLSGIPAPLYERLKELEAEPEVLSAGIYMAMPWFDCPHLGWTITLTTTAADSRWESVVDDLTMQCWELRETMEDVERYSPQEAVQRALNFGGHPVVIGDGADATNSGSPGDGTALLRELLALEEIPHGAMTFVVDPEAVATATTVGEGATFDAMVGGAFSPEFAEPVRLHGSVERLLDVKFILDGHIGKNFPIDMGRGAVIRAGDVSVLLVERSGPGSTPKLYETAGLSPQTCGIVTAKSPAGFRADYEPFVAGVVLADCPGCAAPNWSRLKFHNVNRPLWPLNDIDDPSETAWCETKWTKPR